MNWLVLFIFLVTILCSFSLKCRTTDDEDPVTLTFAEFSITDLYDQINYLNLTECESANGKSDCFCRTELFINHVTNTIEIKFTESLLRHDISEELIQVDTLIRGNEESRHKRSAFS